MRSAGILTRSPKASTAAAGAALVCAALALPGTADATVDTRTVNSTLEPGDGSCATNGCTLREAITELSADNDTVDQDRIHIAFTSIGNHTITLTASLPTIDEPLAIDSTGVVSPIVSGNSLVRPFFINTTVGGDVLISELGIQSGRTTTAGQSGGGIYSANADLTISDAAITQNVSTEAGGGVNAVGGSLTVERSTVADNTADGVGGGVHTTAPAVIRRSTVSGNHNLEGGSPGGGLALTGATSTIESSTISGNFTQGSGSDGGGIAVSNGTIRNSTISGNHTDFGGADGGGILAGGDAILTNTIVANNTVAGSGAGPDLIGGVGAEFQIAYTLVEDTSNAPIVETVPGSNILGQDPALGSLGSNGGPTLTHLPAPASPVIDNGSTDEVTDQRTLARASDFGSVGNTAGGNGADIGAVEVQIAPPTFTSTSPVSPSVNDTPTVLGNAQDSTVRLYTDPGCTMPTGAPTADEDFASTGIVVGPVPRNAVTTFYGTTSTVYGTSLCSSGAFPNSIAYTHADPPMPSPGTGGPTGPSGTPSSTGLRAAALRKCKKKKREAGKKCKKKALKLPV